MAKVLIFGASFSYGVGGEEGGWADLLKKKVHQLMYGPNGIGEKHEVYNFSKPGGMSTFTLETASFLIEKFASGQKKIAIVSTGLNDSRAKEKPDNFVSNIEEFEQSIKMLLMDLKPKVDELICFGYLPVDETKTSPKHNPLTGSLTYFSNQRIYEFNQVFKKICQEEGIKFLELEIQSKKWIDECLWEDGLHPNKLGHQLIFEKLWPEVEKLL